MTSARGQLLARLGAFVRRDTSMALSYRFQFAMDIIRMLASILIAFHVSKLVVAAPELDRYGGSYFDFAIVGLAIMSVAALGVGAFNGNIMAEQSVGTLEVLLATPTRVPVWLTGSFLFPLILTLVELALYLGVGLGIVGSGLSIGGVVLSLPILALTLLSFCAFGIFGAAIVVVVKRGDPLSGPLITLTSILSGALFPVSTFPAPIEALARAFPAFYGIEAMRDALLADAGVADLLPNALVLVGFNVVLVPLSLLVFGRALRSARRYGTLANY